MVVDAGDTRFPERVADVSVLVASEILELDVGATIVRSSLTFILANELLANNPRLERFPSKILNRQ